MYRLHWLLFPLFLLCGLSGTAQTPASWDVNDIWTLAITDHQLDVPPPSTFEREDQQNGWNHRFAGKVDVQETLFSKAQWHRTTEHLIAIERIRIPDSRGFALKIDRPELQPGERLFIYTEAGKLIASFDGGRKVNDEQTSLIIGPEVATKWYVEYNAPWWLDVGRTVEIESVYPVYKNEFLPELNRDLGFGASKPCNNNINCQKGAEWQDEKRGVVRIMVVLEQGIGWCSGSLVNNTSKDGTPYILSAFHCIDGFDPEFDHWRFDFNYESASCQDPPSEPNFNYLIGCEQIAGRRGTDFLLLRLDEEVPADYNAYYNGWNCRENYIPTESVLIHHPKADIKKISFEQQPANIFGNDIHWDNGITTPPYSHYRAHLDDGIFEGGSSGSPYFDPDGLIVGQLHGGSANCSSNYTYCGIFFRSWNGSDPDKRLKDWLDPKNKGSKKWQGMENPASLLMVFSGSVQTIDGQGIRDVDISIEGEIETQASTDPNGFFFVEDVPSTGNYVLRPQKTGQVTNGVSVIDIVILRKHLLGLEPFTEDDQWIAADLNLSGTVSAIDILEIRKVLLGLKTEFTSPSWVFTPDQIQLQDPKPPEETVQFTGIKMGDLNRSVDLSQ